MKLFGRYDDVRIAIFAAENTPPPRKLKRAFSCTEVKIFKGHGPYRHHIDQIQSVLAEAAKYRAEHFKELPFFYDIVVLDSSASYNIFTVTTYANQLLATYQLDAAVSERLAQLMLIKDRLKWESNHCRNLVDSVQRVNQYLASVNLSDPIASRFDAEAFTAQYGQIGAQGYDALRHLIANEASKLEWKHSVPAYQGDVTASNPKKSQAPTLKAA
jgi:hypothetical protein